MAYEEKVECSREKRGLDLISCMQGSRNTINSGEQLSFALFLCLYPNGKTCEAVRAGKLQ